VVEVSGAVRVEPGFADAGYGKGGGGKWREENREEVERCVPNENREAA